MLFVGYVRVIAVSGGGGIPGSSGFKRRRAGRCGCVFRCPDTKADPEKKRAKAHGHGSAGRKRTGSGSCLNKDNQRPRMLLLAGVGEPTSAPFSNPHFFSPPGKGGGEEGWQKGKPDNIRRHADHRTAWRLSCLRAGGVRAIHVCREGRTRVKVLPLSFSLSTRMVPRCIST